MDKILRIGRFVVAAIVIVILVAVAVYTRPSRRNNEDVPERRGAPKRAVPEYVETKKPYDSGELAEDLGRLADSYTEWIDLTSIGQSIWGQKLYQASLGTGKRKILLVGGFHGREWMTSMLLVKMLENYARAAKAGERLGEYQVAQLLRENTISFIPMINPDGVNIAIKALAAGGERKKLLQLNEGSTNFERWKANARGVNLNIQYDANWEQAVSLEAPHFEKYKGKAPESEPESRALADWVRRERPDMVVCYHSSGGVIYWQYGQSGKEYRRDLAMAQRISRLTGYRLAKEVRQEAHGGFKDWFISQFKQPGYTVEIGRPYGDRPLPLNAFPEVWRRNRRVGLEIIKRDR